MAFARALVLGVEGYLALGLLFGLVFAWRGGVWCSVARLDPVARTGTIGFRLLLLPGCAALWPWLLVRLAATNAAAKREPPKHEEGAA